MKWKWITFLGLGIGLCLGGCGGKSEEKESDQRAQTEAKVEETKYHDWDALKMTNGLITVTTVPAIGGRTMAYDLDTYPLLYVNPAEYGRVYPVADTEEARVWHNWGGYKTWPAPQAQWGGPPDPVGSTLDSGAYEGAVVKEKGREASIRVTSTGDDEATGLRFERVLTITKGSTRVQVAQTMTNVGQAPARWSLWDVTQVPGSFSEGETFTEDAQVYFPLNPHSRHKAQFEVQVGEAESQQWRPDPAAGLLCVRYLGETGKIGADSFGGWIAYADARHEVVFVKTFEVFPKEEYPDNGSTVEVYTDGQLPYLEVEVLSPLRQLAPGESYTFTENWYAARCPTPVVAANEVGVISTPLTAETMADTIRVKGTFGVFHESTASFAFYGADDKLLAKSGSVAVSPLEVWKLDEVMRLPEGAVRVAIVLETKDRVEIGPLASVTLPPAGETPEVLATEAPGETGPATATPGTEATPVTANEVPSPSGEEASGEGSSAPAPEPTDHPPAGTGAEAVLDSARG